jgi:flagellar hook assembly protein FlgD
VYSVDGRRVRTLVRESEAPGEYRATWDGRDEGGHPISSGVYYARLETSDRPLTRVITYLR